MHFHPASSRPLRRGLVGLFGALALVSCAHAILTCELNGQPVNPNNGAETAGKTGLMRCKDVDTGQPQREQELQNGRYLGLVRTFEAGQVAREHQVDERGNRDGTAREWNVDRTSGRRTLVREGSNRHGESVGTGRTWNPAGQLARLTSYDDATHREQAAVEFTPDGRLAELRCAARPVFGDDFDDRTACGHAGTASTVVLYADGGRPRMRLLVERGERRRSETLWDNGAVRELREVTASGLVERRFAADGTKRREAVWTDLPTLSPAARPARIQTLEQEFHESGRLTSERRWRLAGRDGVLESESSWYLNGQPKERTEYAEADGPRVRRETRFHDNGKRAFDGSWTAEPSRFERSGRDRPTGTHATFDIRGVLRGEQVYDARGRLAREREFDADGTLMRDDEVFEDGSRKSPGAPVPARAASA